MASVVLTGSKILKSYNIKSHELDAQIILSNIIGLERESLTTIGEKNISIKNKKKFDVAIQRRVKNEPIAYIIGKNYSFFKKQVQAHVNYTISKNIKSALSNIYKDIKSSKNLKKTILLSPAAASFDQFKNFEARGNYFKNLIIKKFKKA